jgi:acylpyruvate hydrolase
MARDPQRWLADGDVLETQVEGIGVLRNTVRLHDWSGGAPSCHART